MGGDRELARRLTEERIPTPAEAAVSPTVMWAAGEWPMEVSRETHWRCGSCNQAVLTLSRGDQDYIYTSTEQTGTLLAHLIQRHGWTRESVGEHG